MKCISIHQPWASCIALGAKRIETRNYATKHRGDLLIHATKTHLSLGAVDSFVDRIFAAADIDRASIPRGAIVAKCKLARCMQIFNANGSAYMADEAGTLPIPIGEEFFLGGYDHYRFAWILEDVVPIGPIPYRGRQSLFDVPDSVIREAA